MLNMTTIVFETHFNVSFTAEEYMLVGVILLIALMIRFWR